MIYVLTNINFTNSSIDDSVKLIKIKGAFKCTEERAIEILKIINQKESMEVEGKSILIDMIGFGINCNASTHQEIEDRKRREELRKKEAEEFEIKRQKASEWFENLTEEEKEFVGILGYHAPVG